jgi:fructokinase
LEARYLAFGIANIILLLSPKRILIGGGVMQAGIFPALRSRLVELLGGYVNSSEITEKIDDYVVPPALGSRAGVHGALVLARRAFVQR